MQSYIAPRNVKELRNVIERAVLLSEEKSIRLGDLHVDGHSGSRTSSYLDSNLTLTEVEKQHIQRVLMEEQGRVEKAAKRLGIPPKFPLPKINKHDLTNS